MATLTNYSLIEATSAADADRYYGESEQVHMWVVGADRSPSGNGAVKILSHLYTTPSPTGGLTLRGWVERELAAGNRVFLCAGSFGLSDRYGLPTDGLHGRVIDAAVKCLTP